MSGSIQQFKVYNNNEAKPASSAIKVSVVKSKCPTCCPGKKCRAGFSSAKAPHVTMSNNCLHTIAYENVDVTVDATYDTNYL